MQNSTELNAQDSAQVSVKSKATGLKRKKKSTGRLAYGVGVNDYDGTVAYTLNGKKRKKLFYMAWHDMMTRCYSDEYKRKKPTYIGCTVCDEWKSLTKFKEWYDKNYINGYHLDKDLLVPGNKVYGPEFCRYITVALNGLLNECKALRGNYPQGVHINKSSRLFISQISINGNKTNLGKFPTVELAESAYKIAKSAEILRQVDLHHGIVCDEILQSLVNIANNL